ncbi:MAG: GNAT family N-acetyltransferase [Anaerolineae bacterium]
MIRFEKARPTDAATLARISERAFHSDIHCGAPGLGGPPGYESEQWQRKMMHIGDYYKILVGDQIVGGFIVLRKGPREYELGRIFVDPDYQNQGAGTQAMEFLWEEYPLAKRWPSIRQPGTVARAISTRRWVLSRWGQTPVVRFSLRRGCLPGEWHGHRKTECRRIILYL